MTTWSISKRTYTQLLTPSHGSNFLENLRSFPNLVPHARVTAIILAVAAGLLVLLQVLTGALMALPMSTIALSVAGLIAVMFIECFMMVYSINCTYVGSLASNNCGVYSMANSVVLSIMFILVSISAIASIGITANALTKKSEKTPDEAQPQAAGDTTTVVPISVSQAFVGIDSRSIDNFY